MPDYEKHHYYVVHSDSKHIRDIASRHGLTLQGTVGQLENYYLLSYPKDHLYKRDPTDHIESLNTDDHVLWAEHQVRSRRLYKRIPPLSSQLESVLLGKRAAPEKSSQIATSLSILDPGFPQQWHLFNSIEIGNDLNLTGVWQQNITGKGVTITLLDDGIDYEHPDIKENFNEAGSYDFNEHKKLPTPKLFDDVHGTRCAGEVSAKRNSDCGVGIAWDSKVSGIRILSGELSQADEAAAINYEFNINHIYSCSWGPRDDGRTMESPPRLAAEAYKRGIEYGRNGKGTIFVFAAGNGGANGDNCNYDGYTNSIYTVTVGAIDRSNNHPSYSEACSANLVVTYSGPHGGPGIYTSDWAPPNQHTCTDRHGGTSAAAPLASGVFALVLQVRPDLTWRDIQDLVVKTARPITLDDSDWQRVAQGRMFNHKFGFGVLDSFRIVQEAKQHALLGPQTHIPSPILNVDTPFSFSEQGVNRTFQVTLDMAKELQSLEHVTVDLTIQHQRRGDVVVSLISPNGYVSNLVSGRPFDEDPNGFNGWRVMSVKHWGENPIGTWTLKVVDTLDNGKNGIWKSWQIIFWGEMKNKTILPMFSSHSEETPLQSTWSTPSLASATVIQTNMPMQEPARVGPNEMAQPLPSTSHPISVILGLIVLGVVIFGCASFLIIWRKMSQNHETLSGFEELNEDDLEDAFGEDSEPQTTQVKDSQKKDVLFNIQDE